MVIISVTVIKSRKSSRPISFAPPYLLLLLKLIYLLTAHTHSHTHTRRVGKLSFREYDDTVPMAQSTSFNESLSKEAGAIQLEEKSDLAAL